jgi:hypothetical protein
VWLGLRNRKIFTSSGGPVSFPEQQVKREPRDLLSRVHRLARLLARNIDLEVPMFRWQRRGTVGARDAVFGDDRDRLLRFR